MKSPVVTVSRCAIAVAMATISIAGCGGKTGAKAAAAVHARTAKPVPAFRVGQYCQPAQVARYRAAGFECEHHHLARR